MATTAITGATATTQTNSPSAAQGIAGTQELGKHDFLKLLVTQLKNQDPLKPVENQEFVAQLAQFSQLEQSSQQVTLLERMIETQAAGQHYSVLPLIGRQVVLNGSLVQLGSGPATLSYHLDAQAASVRVTIMNSANQAVRTMDLGGQNAGAQDVQWNGLDQNGSPVKPGTYQYRIGAVDRNGVPVSVTTTSRVTVTGVQPNGDRPASLLAGDYAFEPADIVQIQ